MQQGGKMQHYLVNPLIAWTQTHSSLTLVHMEYLRGPLIVNKALLLLYSQL